jgi:RNA-binding motif protein, X-linked 2
MNTIREIQKINDHELELGIAGTPGSWHQKYTKCAWVYAGNMDYALTEGDVICIMSQFGEVEDIHLVRDEATGKSKGFVFCKYEDSRSCVLAVDNLCGSQVRRTRALT